MRNVIVGSFVGFLLAAALLAACGGGGLSPQSNTEEVQQQVAALSSRLEQLFLEVQQDRKQALLDSLRGDLQQKKSELRQQSIELRDRFADSDMLVRINDASDRWPTFEPDEVEDALDHARKMLEDFKALAETDWVRDLVAEGQVEGDWEAFALAKLTWLRAWERLWLEGPFSSSAFPEELLKDVQWGIGNRLQQLDDVLVGLEEELTSLDDKTQMEMLNLQSTLQRHSHALQSMSSIMKKSHETTLQIIRNVH